MACGPAVVFDMADAGTETPDAAPTCEELQDMYPKDDWSVCGDDCVSLQNDPANCNGCGLACDYEYENACNDGWCGCGAGFACQPPERCVTTDRASICVIPDYAGDLCDGVDVKCQEGLVCAGGHCTVPVPTTEICDGYDNDHDGRVDESPEDSLVWERDCYSGPAETRNVGECHDGVQACRSGSWTPCFGEVLPYPEEGLFNCDMRDNDCNDCIDDRIEYGELVCGSDVDGHQITFIVDISGSMTDDIDAVVNASATFGAPYAEAPFIEWGIVKIGTSHSPYVDPHLPMSSFSVFNVSLTSIPSLWGGGTEPSWQAVTDMAIGTYDSEMGIRAEPNQIYIVFTDENADGFNNTTGLTESEVCATVAARGATLAVFTDEDSMSSWDACAIVYELTNDVSSMAAKMDDLLDNVCGF